MAIFDSLAIFERVASFHISYVASRRLLSIASLLNRGNTCTFFWMLAGGSEGGLQTGVGIGRARVFLYVPTIFEVWRSFGDCGILVLKLVVILKADGASGVLLNDDPRPS